VMRAPARRRYDKGTRVAKGHRHIPRRYAVMRINFDTRAQTTVDGTSLTRDAGIEAAKLRQAAAAVVVVRSREK
jgi:hypothetical protein